MPKLNTKIGVRTSKTLVNRLVTKPKYTKKNTDSNSQDKHLSIHTLIMKKKEHYKTVLQFKVYYLPWFTRDGQPARGPLVGIST